MDRNDDVSGVISSASTGPLRDYQERRGDIHPPRSGTTRPSNRLNRQHGYVAKAMIQMMQYKWKDMKDEHFKPKPGSLRVNTFQHSMMFNTWRQDKLKVIQLREKL